MMSISEILPREGKKLIYTCKSCKMKTEHIPRGFRGHNYRECCIKCGEIGFNEYD